MTTYFDRRERCPILRLGIRYIGLYLLQQQLLSAALQSKAIGLRSTYKFAAEAVLQSKGRE